MKHPDAEKRPSVPRKGHFFCPPVPPADAAGQTPAR
jgi:hypothetical protein